MEIVWVVPVAGILAVLFSLYLARDVLSRDAGNAKMREIADLIFEGAMAFLRRQYRTIAILAIIVAVIVGAAVGILGGQKGIEGITAFGIAWRTAVAFL